LRTVVSQQERNTVGCHLETNRTDDPQICKFHTVSFNALLGNDAIPTALHSHSDAACCTGISLGVHPQNWVVLGSHSGWCGIMQALVIGRSSNMTSRT